ncbi:hypothetical protein BKA69DRAFT_1048615 [Paraphysoderma sedebokerense]|nr:hypothetical protein BKA69DRAFT_1048615 [Paraphysoderma sedebokerense]
MAEEEICRICRGDGSEFPLFYPCKCTGSIRYVHQDCLTIWLNHSRKTHCELCGFKYQFTPIYSENMPNTIPFTVLVRSALKKVLRTIKGWTRVFIVSIMWILILPYLMFTITESMFGLVGGWSLDKDQSVMLEGDSVVETDKIELTLSDFSSYILESFFQRSVMYEVFEGQLITGASILIAIGVFMLREAIADAAQRLLREDRQRRLREQREALQLFNNPSIRPRTLSQRLNDTPISSPSNTLSPMSPNVMESLPSSSAAPSRHLSSDVSPAAKADASPSLSLQGTSDTESVSSAQQRASSVSHFKFGNGAEFDFGDIAPSHGLNRPQRPRSIYSDTSSDTLASLRQTSYSFSNSRSDRWEDRVVDLWGSDARRASISSLNSQDSDDEEEEDLQETTIREKGKEKNSEIDEGQAKQISVLQKAADEINTSSELIFNEIPNRHRATSNEEGNSYDNESSSDSSSHSSMSTDLPHTIADTAAPTPDVPPLPPPPPLPNAENGNAIEDDAEADLDGLVELLGFRGSPLSMLQSFVVAVLALSAVTFLSQIVPYIIGRIIVMLELGKYIGHFFQLLHSISDPIVDRLLESILPLEFSHAPSSTDSGRISSSNAASNQTTVTTFPMHKEGTVLGSNSMDEISERLKWGDRILCIGLGYMAITTMIIMVSSKKSQNVYVRALRLYLTQFATWIQISAKVTFFILLELALFPTYCGILLDLVTLPLFKSATVFSRWIFHKQFPIVSFFLHWFAGTVFMFHFALFVSLCRSMLRSGVLWFVRDPSDPNFQPMKEIKERPVKSQLKKLFASFVMYTVIVASFFGGAIWGLHLTTNNILPLQLNFSGFGHIRPVDLLAAQILFPIAIKFCQPGIVFKAVLLLWFQLCGRVLRLTSFLFGGRHTLEEGYFSTMPKQISSLFRRFRSPFQVPKPLADINVTVFQNPHLTEPTFPTDHEFIRDGQVMRVPGFDSLKFTPGRQMFFPVDRFGNILQNSAETLGDDPKHWTFVYIPPHFKLRCIALLIMLWLGGVIFAMFSFIGPLLVGRLILRHFTDFAHDMYSLLFGIPIVGMAFAGLFQLAWLFRRLVVSGLGSIISETENADESLVSFCWSHWILPAVKSMYAFIAFAIVLPLGLYHVIDLYLFIPLSSEKPKSTNYVQVSLP